MNTVNKDKEKHRARMRAYYLKTKDAAKKRAKKWRSENHEHAKRLKRDWYKRNHDHSLLKGRHYSATRRANGKASEYQKSIPKADRNRYNARYRVKAVRELSDWYIRGLLKRTYGVANPTDDQMENRRNIIQAKRSQRAMKLSHEASQICI